MRTAGQVFDAYLSVGATTTRGDPECPAGFWDGVGKSAGNAVGLPVVRPIVILSDGNHVRVVEDQIRINGDGLAVAVCVRHNIKRTGVHRQINEWCFCGEGDEGFSA